MVDLMHNMEVPPPRRSDPASRTADTLNIITHRDNNLASIDSAPARLSLLQMRDAALGPIYKAVMPLTKASTFNDPILVMPPDAKHQFTIINTTLYVMLPTSSETLGLTHTQAILGNNDLGNLSFAVPPAMRNKFINEAHNATLAGSLGTH